MTPHQIFETFGSVQQPFYSLRFPATAVPDPAVFTVGRAVHYAPKMASFVFTRDIRNIKGSDASNIWDEEVGAAEMEWSDDEAEQEYKRSVKAECVLILLPFTSFPKFKELIQALYHQAPFPNRLRDAWPVLAPKLACTVRVALQPPTSASALGPTLR